MEEGQQKKKNGQNNKVKVSKITRKRIKKDKKYCDFEAKQTQRLLDEPAEQVEETKKDKWTDLMAKIFEHNDADDLQMQVTE